MRNPASSAWKEDATNAYFHGSKYGQCIEYIDHHCDEIDSRFESTANIIGLVGALIGIVNNILSVSVFFKRKYNKRLLPFLLRCLYVSNLTFTITIILTVLNSVVPVSGDFNAYEIFFRKDLVRFTMLVALMTSDGLVAYMSILRLLHSRFPNFISFSAEAFTLTYLILMLMVVTYSGINIGILLGYSQYRWEEYTTVVSISITAIIIVIVNAVWIIQEQVVVSEIYRRYSIPNNKRLSISGQQLFIFAALSSALMLATKLPSVIYVFYPDDGSKKNCRMCHETSYIGIYLYQLMFYNCYLDNLLYCMLSKRYRYELGKILRTWRCACLMKTADVDDNRQTTTRMVDQSRHSRTSGISFALVK